ncbi:hypothetical protein PR003_g20397 [Phytophthora rubi]|uniref:BZIP domain-containing protein n=1 Tax=Phytophthora rubi TaxID=129364 RepID=A0A6A3JN17_9STRA|nr:hypothetical protein PR002_g19811 [Phytophthora rubi]KAE8998258.1 hypothetical protein PR001_g19380 [Phytophthora rubi]KAE9309913.1 hypothetical protein PR003_g20397 [Phytophthora rubi]
MDALPEPLALTALLPLSPTMERAFSEAFADMSELEKSAVIKLETPSWPCSDDDAVTKPRAASSPAPAPASASQQLKSMSPSENKSKSESKQQAAEDKRARRSAIEKKSRQRRQNVLRRMRDEVKQLEGVFAAVTQRKDAPPAAWSGSGGDALQQKYSELSLVAHALEEDQEALQRLLQQHEEFNKTVRGLADEDEADKNKHKVWDTGVPPSSSFRAKFKQMSVAQCYALVRESYEQIQRFNESDNFETTGANFMGWTDKRKYDSRTGALQYGFAKKFPMESAEGLLMKTWEIFSDGPKFREMSFDGSIDTRYEVLQELNDDLLIVRRDHRIPNIETTFATIQFMFRLQTPTGYTLCMRTIPAPEIQDVMAPHEYFYEVFHWTHFNRMYDEFGDPAGCELVAAGSIEDQNQLKSTYWLFELVCSMLRWENACVGPLFLKQL